MGRDFTEDVQRLRAYALLAIGCRETADATLHSYLSDVIDAGDGAPEFSVMLAWLHRDIGRRGLLAGTRSRGLTDAQRVLRWRLGRLSGDERGLLLLRCAAGSAWGTVAAMPGMALGDADAMIARAHRGVRRGAALVLSQEAGAAIAMKTMFAQVGLPWIETASDIQGLRALLIRHQPEVVIADTDGIDPESLATYLGEPHAPQRVPAVVITSDGCLHARFPVVLGKPVSPARLRAAVLAAIEA